MSGTLKKKKSTFFRERSRIPPEAPFNLILDYYRQSDDQNDQNQINVNDESMNKSITSGTTDEVSAKLLKHLEIYKANVASQEEEIKHMDELYQDLVDSVLNVSFCEDFFFKNL